MRNKHKKNNTELNTKNIKYHNIPLNSFLLENMSLVFYCKFDNYYCSLSKTKILFIRLCKLISKHIIKFKNVLQFFVSNNIALILKFNQNLFG